MGNSVEVFLELFLHENIQIEFWCLDFNEGKAVKTEKIAQTSKMLRITQFI